MRVGRQSAGFALAVRYLSDLSWSNCLDRGCSKLAVVPGTIAGIGYCFPESRAACCCAFAILSPLDI
jgi:hypothetical protein